MQHVDSIIVDSEVVGSDGAVNRRKILYEFHIKNSGGSVTGDFILQITDPIDPGFLFDMTMPSGSFAKIKSELNLLCEFIDFPKSFHKLLSNCNTQGNWQLIIDSKSFDTPMLVIRERTEFNIINHLKLPIVLASDSRLNEYLTTEVKKYKFLAEQNAKKVEQLESNVQKTSLQSETMTKQLEQTYKDQIEEISNAKNQIVQEYESKLRLMKSQYNNELKNIDEKNKQQYQQIVQQYEEKIKTALSENKELKDSKYELNATIAKYTERVQLLESQVNELKQDIQRKEEDGKQFNTTLLQTTHNEATLKSMNSNLLSENNQLKQQLESITKQNNQYINQLRSVMNENVAKDKEIENLTKNVENLSKEVSQFDLVKAKCKEVIERYLMQNNELKEQYNELYNDFQKDEEYISELRQNLESGSMILNEYKAKIKELSEKNDELTIEVKELENSLHISESTIKTLELQLEQKTSISIGSKSPRTQIAIDGDINQSGSSFWSCLN